MEKKNSSNGKKRYKVINSNFNPDEIRKLIDKTKLNSDFLVKGLEKLNKKVYELNNIYEV